MTRTEKRSVGELIGLAEVEARYPGFTILPTEGSLQHAGR